MYKKNIDQPEDHASSLFSCIDIFFMRFIAEMKNKLTYCNNNKKDVQFCQYEFLLPCRARVVKSNRTWALVFLISRVCVRIPVMTPVSLSKILDHDASSFFSTFQFCALKKILEPLAQFHRAVISRNYHLSIVC